MPNGRSGGFVISKIDLAAALTAVSDATAIGAIIRNRAGADVKASAVSEFLQSHPLDVVAVEEQHRDPTSFTGRTPHMGVRDTASLLFAELNPHVQYLADHPG